MPRGGVGVNARGQPSRCSGCAGRFPHTASARPKSLSPAEELHSHSNRRPPTGGGVHGYFRTWLCRVFMYELRRDGPLWWARAAVTALQGSWLDLLVERARPFRPPATTPYPGSTLDLFGRRNCVAVSAVSFRPHSLSLSAPPRVTKILLLPTRNCSRRRGRSCIGGIFASRR